MKENYSLSSKVFYKNGRLIDIPLNRTAKIGNPTNDQELEELNKLYFLNLGSIIRSQIRGVPYRADISGFSFFKIMSGVLRVFLNRKTIFILAALSAFAVVSGNFWVLAALTLALDTLLSFCFHESLHLYFRRRFTSHDEGTLIVQGIKLFVLFPERQTSVVCQLVVSGCPAILATIIGISMNVIPIVFIPNPLLVCLCITYSLPWVAQIMSLLPFTSDFMGIARAMSNFRKR